MKNQVVSRATGLLLTVLSTAGFAAGVIVADPSSTLGPVSAAQGASNLAGNLRHDSLILNPAAATADQQYSLEALYGASGDLLSASIVDTKSGPVGGGAYYMRRNTHSMTPDGILGNYDRAEETAGLSVMGKISDALGVGVSGRYIKTTIPGDKTRSDWDGDLGLRWTVSPQVVVGAVARSLLKEKSGLSPTQYGAGVTYVPYPGLSFSAALTKTALDAINTSLAVTVPDPSNKMTYAAGAEWRMTNGIGIRAGYNQLGPWAQSIASGGVGYVNKGFSVDYSYSWSTRGPEYQQHLFGLGVAL